MSELAHEALRTYLSDEPQLHQRLLLLLQEQVVETGNQDNQFYRMLT